MNHAECALVTGASGYIGSNLVKALLVRGWQVHVLLREQSSLQLISDLGSEITIHRHHGSTQELIEIMRRVKPSTVFHLASLFLVNHKSNDIEALITSNILFSTQLLEAMSVTGVMRLVNTGTSWQFFDSDVYRPVNLYAATKQAFEDLLFYFADAHGVRAVTLHLFDTYGLADPRPKLIALLRKTARSQMPLAMSPGEQLIDLVYIDDVIQAYLLSAELIGASDFVSPQSFGVSSGSPIRIKDLVALFERVWAVKLPIRWAGRPYREREVLRSWMSSRRLPGWSPKVTLESGLAKLRASE